MPEEEKKEREVVYLNAAQMRERERLEHEKIPEYELKHA
jgi:hypothetical protein